MFGPLALLVSLHRQNQLGLYRTHLPVPSVSSESMRYFHIVALLLGVDVIFGVVCSASRRRAMEVARQQMYNSRNALHHDLQLPDGYG